MKKVLVIIPDGVSLRNFLFTDFPEEAREAGIELIYWNATPYDISSDGEKEIKLTPKPKALTDLYKRAKINAELDHFKDKFNDPIYEKYRFEPNRKGWKNKLKNLIVERLGSVFSGEEGLKTLRERIKSSERNSAYYKTCREVLEGEKPDLVFCANQRPIDAIAPLVAANDLDIPTACFIFSWDNLPKATKVVDTNHYFVWSNHMKKELLAYYPYIEESQIRVTGSPQFEIHYNEQAIMSRKEFCRKYDMDTDREYLCFSGDDVTTSPHDEVFLKDVAEAVRRMNEQGEKIGIIFRRCPVDNSNRYQNVLEDFSEQIKEIPPIWADGKGAWNSVMPTREDLILQTNIISHCFLVVNVGSSMVFDFAAKKTPCAYLNYKPKISLEKDIREVYKYTHFRSMPDPDSVLWINSSTDIPKVILSGLKQANEILPKTQSWFDIINEHQVKSSQRLAQSLKSLTEARN